jgi:hypothetical protein
MNIEYEAKFLDIDEKKIKKKLIELGAMQVHDKIMLKRTAFKLCDKTVKGYVRIRDEGKSITMTSKIYTDPKFPEEYEISINQDYETGYKFLKSLGMEQKAVQESYREKWKHELAHEITFDTLPGLPTYMELDCTSEDKLNKLIELIGLDKTKMRFGAFDKTYEEYYGIDVDVINNNTPSLTFKNIISEIKPTKNKDMLMKIYKSYNFNNSSNNKKTSKKISKKISKKTSKNKKMSKNKKTSKK